MHIYFSLTFLRPPFSSGIKIKGNAQLSLNTKHHHFVSWHIYLMCITKGRRQACGIASGTGKSQLWNKTRNVNEKIVPIIANITGLLKLLLIYGNANNKGKCLWKLIMIRFSLSNLVTLLNTEICNIQWKYKCIQWSLVDRYTVCNGYSVSKWPYTYLTN